MSENVEIQILIDIDLFDGDLIAAQRFSERLFNEFVKERQRESDTRLIESVSRLNPEFSDDSAGFKEVVDGTAGILGAFTFLLNVQGMVVAMNPDLVVIDIKPETRELINKLSDIASKAKTVIDYIDGKIKISKKDK